MKKITLFAISLMLSFSANAQNESMENELEFPDLCRLFSFSSLEKPLGNTALCRQYLIGRFSEINGNMFYTPYIVEHNLVLPCEELGCCSAQEIEMRDEITENFRDEVLQLINQTLEKIPAVKSEEQYEKIQENFFKEIDKKLQKIDKSAEKTYKLSAYSLNQCKQKLFDIYAKPEGGILKSKFLRKDCDPVVVANRLKKEQMQCEPDEDDFEVPLLCHQSFKDTLQKSLIEDGGYLFPDDEMCCNENTAKASVNNLEMFKKIIENGIDTLIEDAQNGENRIEDFYEMRNNALKLMLLQNEDIDGFEEYVKCFTKKKDRMDLHAQVTEFAGKNADIMVPDEIKCYGMTLQERNFIAKRQSDYIEKQTLVCKGMKAKMRELPEICVTLLSSTPTPKQCPQYIGGKMLQKMFPECYSFMENKIGKFKDIVDRRKKLAEFAEKKDNYDLSSFENDEEDSIMIISDVKDDENLSNECKEVISQFSDNAETLLDDDETFEKCNGDNEEECSDCRENCEDIEDNPEEAQKCYQECAPICNISICCQKNQIKVGLIKQKYAELVRDDVKTFKQDIENGVPLYRALIDFDLRAALSFEKNNNNILEYNRSIDQCAKGM